MAFHHTPKFTADGLRREFPGPDPASVRNAKWIIVLGNRVLVSEKSRPTIVHDRIPGESSSTAPAIQFLGWYCDIPCYAAAVPEDAPVPEQCTVSGARELFGSVPDEETGIAAFAIQVTDFDRKTRYCGRCGATTRPLAAERAKECLSCGLIVYPRISPAIIVLVKKGDTILLARSHRFPGGIHSLIAGFVEPGETIEQAVHREVREETGIGIANVRYAGSEPWPFPDSLMIAFTADYLGGTVQVDPAEIASAGWFDRANLPLLPPATLSISRALIDWWREDSTLP